MPTLRTGTGRITIAKNRSRITIQIFRYVPVREKSDFAKSPLVEKKEKATYILPKCINFLNPFPARLFPEHCFVVIVNFLPFCRPSSLFVVVSVVVVVAIFVTLLRDKMKNGGNKR